MMGDTIPGPRSLIDLFDEAFDLYKRPRVRALLATWLVGVTAGVLLRALLRWHIDGGDAAFLAVALCFTLLFVAVVRIAVSFVRT